MIWFWLWFGWKYSRLGGNTIWYRGIELHDERMSGVVNLCAERTGMYFSIDIKER